MNRLVPAIPAIALALLLASCGGKPAGDSSTAGGGSAAPSGGTAASNASGPAATSRYDAGPRAGESAVDEELAEQGEELFKNKGCSACHAFGKRVTGPDLAGVSMRRTAAWMENQILHPEVMVKEDPISRGLFGQYALQMPNQGLKPEEAHAVIEYFKHMDHEAGEKKSGSHE